MKIRRSRRAALNRAAKAIMKREVKPMDYVCEFVNKSRTPYKVYERGKHLMDVPAEGKSRLEMFKPQVSWARWAKVVIGKDGDVESLTENIAWAAPWKKEDDLYLVEFFNEHGAAGGQNVRLIEPNPVLRAGTPFLLIPKGIPQLLPVTLADPWIKYCRVHWRFREKKSALGTSGYHTKEWEVYCEKALRPQDELVKIYTRRAAINAEAFEREQRKMLPTLGLDDSALQGQE
jgi:hypothetical protein